MNSIEQKIKAYAKRILISDIGVCKAREFSELEEVLASRPAPFCRPAKERISPFLLLSCAKSIIMCIFNYYAGENEGANLSKYVWGKDYHLVVTEKLTKLCDFLKKEVPDFKGVPFVDTSPMCDKYLAYQAGLGFFGNNGLLINPKFGSYVFIGGIVTNLELTPSVPLENVCLGCGACIRACPAGAIGKNGVDGFRCASYIAQKKGELLPEEKDCLKKTGKVWGCDICSEVCPHNASPIYTQIKEFATNLTYSIDKEQTLNEAEFKSKFSDKAFSWRGAKIIRRNLQCIK